MVNVPDLEKQKLSATVLANAGALMSGVIKDIAGNDISNSLNGSRLTNEMIQTIGHQRIARDLGV